MRKKNGGEKSRGEIKELKIKSRPKCNRDQVTKDQCLMAYGKGSVWGWRHDRLVFDLLSFRSSDLTTLTSAAYQQGLTVHTGTHLLSMQGEG